MDNDQRLGAPLPHPTPVLLSADDAWRIAMTWRDALHGRVTLVTDRTGDGPVNSIVERYAWIDMDAGHAVTHAAMRTWTALAACPGFGGHENAAFWKRVFGALQDEPTTVSLLSLGSERNVPAPITDAHGFFDGVGQSFPRFRLLNRYPHDDSFYDHFTPSGPPLPVDVREALTTILTSLRPYQSPQKRHHVIDVCLSINPIFEYDRGLALFTRAIHESTRARTTTLDSGPRLQIAQLGFAGDSLCLSGEDDFDLDDDDWVQERLKALPPPVPQALPGSDLEKFLTFMDTAPFRVTHFALQTSLRKYSRAMKAQWIGALLRLDGSSALSQLTSITLSRRRLSNDDFDALFSALPFARSVHSLQMDDVDDDVAWIAYAIFHPQASSSSWRHLELENLTITDELCRALSAMARGNNLVVLLNGTEPKSDAYYRGDLVANTSVFRKPSARSDVVFTALDEHDGSSATVVDVCGISSLDPATWATWVAVVVPAFGLGYVRKYEMVRVCAFPSSRPNLTGLHLHRKRSHARNAPPDDAPEALLRLLPSLGRSLTYLNIDSYTNVSASTLYQILRLCPSLKVLITSHNGDFWAAPQDSDAAVPLRESSLEELELNVYYGHARVAEPSVPYLKTVLRRLRAVRIRVWDNQLDQLSASRSTLETLLAHAPSLAYLHWRHDGANYVRKDRDHPIPYAQSALWTPRALADLGLTDDTYRYAHRPIDPASAAAFLSVVESKRRGSNADASSALARLVDHGVLTTIFQFATTAVARVIHIEPNDKNP